MSELIHSKEYKIRALLLILIDIIIIVFSSFFALYLRYEFRFNDIDEKFIESMIKYAPVNILMILGLFFAFRLYSSIWKYASVREMVNIILACIMYFLIEIIEIIFFGLKVPRSHPFIFSGMLLMGTIGVRFGYRFIRAFKHSSLERDEGKKRTMIIGAGQAGAMLLKEIDTSSYTHYKVICLIDDDKRKHGKYLSGVKIAGGRDRIAELAAKYNIEQIIVAMPSADRKVISDILKICQETDCKLKKIPGIYQLVNGNVSVDDIRNVEIEDLLGREQIKVDLEKIMDYVSGKTVMVTGGGGSIGSELCRQIAGHRPDIVYHAAAHKHVPLMEDSPNEAIKNNVFGTYKTAMAAGRYGVSKFVLISTDKAVNPTNIMGASKRICEMIIQMLNNEFENTNFVAVRFGNVLGSNGSVIPLFKKQIKEGGPVTVTHPDIIRYFMTIPEAVSLVLQAGVYAKGGEIFVLDMGEPVKILDLAKNLIRLSGYSEDDIEITFTGLRPGEKLYEELLMNEEGLKSTENKLIHIGHPIEFDENRFKDDLKKLKEACEEDNPDIRKYVKEMVSTYNYKS